LSYTSKDNILDQQQLFDCGPCMAPQSDVCN